MNNAQPITLTGRYALAPNPCTTDPCLPGLACAVESGSQWFILTFQGRWSDRSRAWGDWTPQVGDQVIVVGMMAEQRDIHNQPFLTLEVQSMKLEGGAEAK